MEWKKWDNAPRDANPDEIAKPDYNDGSWSAVDSGSFSLKLNKGNTWYRGTFTASPDQIDSLIESPLFQLPKPEKPQKSLPPPARTLFYLNGHPITEPIADASKYLTTGKNTVLLETQSRLGGEIGNLAIALWHNSPLTHSKWFFHGGIGDLSETAVIGRVTNWIDFLARHPWSSGSPSTPEMPTFWKCAFTYNKSDNVKESIGLDTTGLKAGHVWLNGHNLGESPQAYPLYMSEAWLKNGENDLVIFDLYGNRPDQVKLIRYEAFSIHGAN